MSKSITHNTTNKTTNRSTKPSLFKSHPLLLTLSFAFILALALSLTSNLNKTFSPVFAQDNDPSDGITVDSTLDTPDNNIGDDICDDGAGNCTLRAAIEEANSNPDPSTILFNISGTPDFTNNSQSGYTIKPQSNLPDITEQLTINGYSQPGAQPNTAPAPQPMNGTLLIELDGSAFGNTSDRALMTVADQTVIKGLSINSFNGPAILIQAADVVVRGNYLGTNPEGMAAKPNVTGVNTFSGPDRGVDALVGGINPEDRNIISGNTAGGGSASGGYPGKGWVFKGNYIGVGADGLSAIPNSSIGGSGALSIDVADGTIIGGPESTAINVISGNLSHGLAPHDNDGLLIQGNYIGVGYDGTTPISNGTTGSGGAGITLGLSNNVSILDNLIANNKGDGIWYSQGENYTISGNTIRNNNRTGISIGDDVYNTIIGGTSSSDANQIYSNGISGIDSSNNPSYSNRFSILRNSIHDNTDLGIAYNFSTPTPNDPLDSDSGPNDLLNFPRWTNLEESSGNTTVDYQLDVPAGDYRIEFFSNTTADPSGYGEGQTYLGYQNVTSSGSGSQAFSYTLTGTTGVTNLAMTTTEIDPSTPSGFGATSEFGNQLIVTDVSVTNTLTNPQDVALGATLNYAIQYTNNGPSDLDLTQFDFNGAYPLLYYFVHPDLTASDLGSPGPFPGSYALTSTGDPNVACLWAANGYVYLNPSHQDGYGMIACYYTGSPSTLPAHQSINLSFNFTLSANSGLTFDTRAAVIMVESDPDHAAVNQAVAQYNNDVLAATLNHPEINNFAVALYPISQDSTGNSANQNSPGGTLSVLASTGENVRLLVALSLSAFALIPVSLLFFKRRFARARI